MNTTHTFTRTHIDARSLVLASLATVCLAVAATGAHAQDSSPGTEPTKMVVNYADLNLASPKAIDALYRRIVAAARHVCDSGQNRVLSAKQRDWSCSQQSIARAVGVVNVPALTALHAQKTGQPGRPIELAKQ